MTRAKKASAKKTQKRGIKWANIIFLIVSALVALSMLIGAVANELEPAPIVPTPTPVVSQ